MVLVSINTENAWLCYSKVRNITVENTIMYVIHCTNKYTFLVEFYVCLYYYTVQISSEMRMGYLVMFYYQFDYMIKLSIIKDLKIVNVLSEWRQSLISQTWYVYNILQVAHISTVIGKTSGYIIVKYNIQLNNMLYTV